MANTPDVTATYVLPSGAFPENAFVEVVGVFSTSKKWQYAVTNGGTVIQGTYRFAVSSSDGTVTFTSMHPNSGASADAIASPAGTTWKATLHAAGEGPFEPVYFTVTDDAGPLALSDLITSAPDNLTPNLALSGLSNVTAGSPADNDSLFYDSSSSQWVNTTAVTARSNLGFNTVWTALGEGRIATVGDSINAGQGGTLSGSDTQVNEATSPFDVMMAVLGRNVSRIANACVAGSYIGTSLGATYATQFSNEIDGSAADVVLIQVSGNSISWASINGYDLTVVGDWTAWLGPQYDTFLATVLAANMQPVLIGPFPRGDGSFNAELDNIERESRQWAKTNRVPYISARRTLTDTSDGSFDATLDQGLLLHPSAAGAEAAGAELAAQYLALGLPTTTDVRGLIRYDGDVRCLAGSTFSSGDTSGMPNGGWYSYAPGSGTGTRSVDAPAASDIIDGNWATVTQTGGTSFGNAIVTASFTSGHEYILSAIVTVSTLAGGAYPQVSVGISGTDYPLFDDTFADVADFDNRVYTRRFTAGATASGVLRCFVTGGTGTAQFGNVTLIDVTSEGEI